MAYYRRFKRMKFDTTLNNLHSCEPNKGNDIKFLIYKINIRKCNPLSFSSLNNVCYNYHIHNTLKEELTKNYRTKIN